MGNYFAPEEDIIIKCSVDEMLKCLFKDYMIVWHDPNINSEENQGYILQLQKLWKVRTFTDWKEASIFVKDTKEILHVITSGTDGELLTKEISSSQNVLNVYIFCGNKSFHSTWAKNYSEVACVEDEIQGVLFQVKQNLLEWQKDKSSFRTNLPAFAPIFNDSDTSQMNHLHLYLKVIPRFKNRLQAKTDFVTLSRATYLAPNQIQLIDDFEKNYNNYNKKEVLIWYTKECFLYKLINNCLRVATSDSIQYCCLLLKDLEQAIKEQYQSKSKNFSGLLYRGAYLSDEEWTKLQKNVGREIEMHGFLSTSKSKTAAISFLEPDPAKQVFITIIVPKGPNDEEQGFAEIAEFSEYPEEEILFNMRSRFTVLETETEYSPDLPYRHLVLFYGAQGFRKFLTEHDITQEIPISSLENILCTLCKGALHRKSTEMFFLSLENQCYFCQRCLADFPQRVSAPLLCIPINHNLIQEVEISRRKIRGFSLASPIKIPFYGYACDKCKKKKQEFYLKCLECNQGKAKWCVNCIESFSDCLKAGHNVVLENSPFNFWCEKMNENEKSHWNFHDTIIKGSTFQQAWMYFESHQYLRAVDYFQEFIEKNKNIKKDDRFAAACHGIAVVYDSHGEYKKALEYYSKSLEIYKSILGENHSDTATSYNNMGNVYYNQGEYKEALEYYSKSLEIRKSIHGENHPSTATSYHNIGIVYDNQGEYKKALEYHSKALEIRISVFGKDHPHSNQTLDNIKFISKKLNDISSRSS